MNRLEQYYDSSSKLGWHDLVNWSMEFKDKSHEKDNFVYYDDHTLRL
jgi:hypothetical protein